MSTSEYGLPGASAADVTVKAAAVTGATYEYSTDGTNWLAIPAAGIPASALSSGSVYVKLTVAVGTNLNTIAKMGLWALTQTAAQGLAPDIRVNAIGPGPTLRGARQSDEHFARQRAATILERGAGPEDICAALGYLMDAPAVTGQLLCVDGGQHLAWRTPDILGVE